MDSALFLTIIQSVLMLCLEVLTPVLVIAMVIGLIISIFQSVTQIQESTLTFVPKIIVCILSLIFLMPWMVSLFISRTNELFNMIQQIIR